MKAVFAGAVAFLLAPLVASLPGAQTSLSVSGLIGELAVGLVYGLSLTLLTEMLIFAGQIVGLQLSFSLVNLLDPDSAVQTPIMGEIFQMMGLLVVITAGLDRILAGFDGPGQLSHGATGQLCAGRALCRDSGAGRWRRLSGCGRVGRTGTRGDDAG